MSRPRWKNADTMLYRRWNSTEAKLCNVEKRFYWRCPKLVQRCSNVGHRRCIKVVQCWKSDVRFCFIFNVGSRLLQHLPTTFKQSSSDVENLPGIEPPLLSYTPACGYKFHALLVHIQPIFTTPTIAGAFGIQPNICSGALFANIVNLLRPLAIFAGELHRRCLQDSKCYSAQ